MHPWHPPWLRPCSYSIASETYGFIKVHLVYKIHPIIHPHTSKMSEDWASHNVDKTCFKNFNQWWVSEFLQRMLSNKITFCKSWFLIQIMLTLNEIYFWHKCCLFPFFLVETSETVFRWIIVHDDNYVDLSDLYVDLSVIYVDLSHHYVDLSEKYHHN